MTTTPPTHGLLATEAGDTLIEVIIGAAILIIIVLGTLAGFDIAGKQSAHQRQYQEAEALADQKEDQLSQKSVSSLRLADSEGQNAEEVEVDGTKYKITYGVYYENAKGESECSTSNGDSTYLKTETSVTWAGMPNPNDPVRTARFVSLDRPGGLIVHAGPLYSTQPWTVANGTGDAFVQLGFAPPHSESEFGPTQFASTGEDGCAVFSGLIPGQSYMARPVNYFLSVNDAHLVTDTIETGKNKFYEYPFGQDVTIPTNGTTASVSFVFALPGAIKATFKSNGATAHGETITVTNSLETTPEALYFPSVPTSPSEPPAKSEITAERLFPFSEPGKTTEKQYSVYAGGCTTNKPPTGETEAKVGVTPGSAATTNAVVVQVPPVNVKIYSGESASSPGTAQTAAPASIHVTETGSGTGSGCGHKYEYESSKSQTTTPSSATGALVEPALPFGTYEVCVAEHLTNEGGTTSGTYYEKVTGVKNEHESGTTATLYWKKATTASCP